MTEGTEQKRRVSLIGILFALVFLAVASVGLSGNALWLLSEGTKWAATGALALIGIGLVATTLPGLRKRR
jgi:predicted tellurium resistance membrane protein TerC